MAEGLVDAGEVAEGEEGGAADVEPVVVAADVGAVEEFLPDGGEALFGGGGGEFVCRGGGGVGGGESRDVDFSAGVEGEGGDGADFGGDHVGGEEFGEVLADGC